ncbi:MAG: hypothetical protein H0W44_00050 [Gammaproteobacteria bacterium]|nr:hypothetical protein [Gammaproteobacteria bacterium]
MNSIRALVGVAALCVITLSWAADTSAPGREELKGIDDQVQTLKKDVIQINQELSLLEEKLLFPSTTQVSVFLSLSTKDEFFQVDSVDFTLDAQVVANHVYSFREVEALQKGGVQRLYTGNATTGKHQGTVTVKGRSAGEGTSYTRKAAFEINKELGPKFVEIQVVGNPADPQIKVKHW